MALAHANPADAESGRERILHRAAELFLARGYAETSLRTIADAAEMRPASIYYHFESKDHLLTEILDRGIDGVMTAFDEAEKRVEGVTDGRTRLNAHVAGHMHALFANQVFTAAHITIFPFIPDTVRARAVPQRDEYEARWTELLEGIATQLPKQAVAYIRLSLFGAMNSSLHWFDPANGTVDKLAAAIVATLWNGIESHQ